MSADNSLWSPVGENEESYLSEQGYGTTLAAATTTEGEMPEYYAPREPDYNPLVPIPDTVEEQHRKMEEVLENLRLIVGRVEEERDFGEHLANFVKSATSSNLAGEPQPTTENIKKMMKEFDSVRLDDSQQQSEQGRANDKL